MSSGSGEVTLALGGDLGACTSFAGEEEFFTEEVETARHLLVLPLGRDGICHLRTEGEQSRSFFQLVRRGTTTRRKHSDKDREQHCGT